MPIFDALRPEGPREEGFAHAGPVGAGHFAKMVHNGIEYGLMQAYAEGYELMAATELITNVTGVIQAWSRGTVVRSWLLDLLVLRPQGRSRADKLSDYVDDSGEGRWTIEEAIKHAVPLPVISAALFARFASRQESLAGDARRGGAAPPVRRPRRQGGRARRVPRASWPARARAPARPRRRSRSSVHLRRLAVLDFRSWEHAELALEPGVTVLVGPNGAGKTNLVEAVGLSRDARIAPGVHRRTPGAPRCRAGGRPRHRGAPGPGAGRRAGDRARAGEPRPGEPRPGRAAAGRARHPAHGPVRPRGPRAGPRRPGRAAPLRRRPARSRRPRYAAVRADYDRVLKQRSALLKTARAGRSAGRADRGRSPYPGRVGRPPRPAWCRAAGRAAGAGGRARRSRRGRLRRGRAVVGADRAGLPRLAAGRAAPHAGGAGAAAARGAGPGARPGGGARHVPGRAASRRPRVAARSAGRPRVTPATASRGRWRWRCGWPPTGCCAPTTSSRC